jgi:plasmid stability protein
MRNITVAVPDDVYRQARIEAAKQGRSVSALVAGYLATLAEAGSDFDRLLARQEEVLAEIDMFRAGDRLDRERLHERAVR